MHRSNRLCIARVGRQINLGCVLKKKREEFLQIMPRDSSVQQHSMCDQTTKGIWNNQYINCKACTIWQFCSFVCNLLSSRSLLLCNCQTNKRKKGWNTGVFYDYLFAQLFFFFFLNRSIGMLVQRENSRTSHHQKF